MFLTISTSTIYAYITDQRARSRAIINDDLLSSHYQEGRHCGHSRPARPEQHREAGGEEAHPQRACQVRGGGLTIIVHFRSENHEFNCFGE